LGCSQISLKAIIVIEVFMGIEKLSTENSGESLHIAILGRKNVGKSSLLNRINGGELLDVKVPAADINNLEIKLSHHGSVVTIDINNIEDLREAGEKRISRTIRILSFTDFAILVLDAREQLDTSETTLITYLQKIKVPFLIAVNKVELGINPHLLTELEALELIHFEISCKEKAGIENFVKKIIHLLPSEIDAPMIIDLIGQKDIVLLVGQIDSDLTKEGFTKFSMPAFSLQDISK
jgi:small GTP-binding protein